MIQNVHWCLANDESISSELCIQNLFYQHCVIYLYHFLIFCVMLKVHCILKCNSFAFTMEVFNLFEGFVHKVQDIQLCDVLDVNLFGHVSKQVVSSRVFPFYF